ncbi:MAG: 6,7-dimethyl-8-ribityllumazine synthase [Gemmataceae bacterium]|nr:6,7-dimethyl-8-ribityllumazine synthase [Gemmataceae bacterium]
MSDRYAIVAARFNAEVVDKLLSGAREAFAQLNVPESHVDVRRVPGAFELPLVAKVLAETGRYAAVVCLGAVIRGDTDHYDYVCQAATQGILRVGLDTGIPVIFGVLTCDTDEQAAARTGGAHGNKGADAARAAFDTVAVIRQIEV